MGKYLRSYHGPTDADPDPGKQWCYDCGGEVFSTKVGPGDTITGCSQCGRIEQDDARPACSKQCGCRVGIDSWGNYDADKYDCGCDGECTTEECDGEAT